jgi:hypothetical protein
MISRSQLYVWFRHRTTRSERVTSVAGGDGGVATGAGMQTVEVVTGDDVGGGGPSRCGCCGLRFWSSRREKEPLESVLRCLGRGLSFTEDVEEAAVDTVEEVESLRSRHPNETSDEAEDEGEGATGDMPPCFNPPYGVSNLRAMSNWTRNIANTLTRCGLRVQAQRTF